MTSRPSRDAPGLPIDPGMVADRESSANEYSTFRPNPVGSAAGGKPRGSKKTRCELTRSPKSLKRRSADRRWWERILFGRVSTGQLAQFCRQFGAYLQAGVDLTKSLVQPRTPVQRDRSGADPGPDSG